jgi:hypothetical protein
LRLYDDYGSQKPTNLGCGRRAHSHSFETSVAYSVALA